MSIEALKQQIPDFAKDVRLNLSGLVNDESFGEETKYGLLLACAIAARNPRVLEAMEQEAAAHLSPKARAYQPAQAALSALAAHAPLLRLSRRRKKRVCRCPPCCSRA